MWWVNLAFGLVLCVCTRANNFWIAGVLGCQGCQDARDNGHWIAVALDRRGTGGMGYRIAMALDCKGTGSAWRWGSGALGGNIP